MAVHSIRLLGDPILRTLTLPVKNFEERGLKSLVHDLSDTLTDFKNRNGFGRGIAAPQIGESRRVIVVRMTRPLAMINPIILSRSRRLMTLWDDCFSFPDILVRLRRHQSIQVEYQDLTGIEHRVRAEGALSELLQHEIDHLDGILAIDRAIDSRHIILRSELGKWDRGSRGEKR